MYNNVYVSLIWWNWQQSILLIEWKLSNTICIYERLDLVFVYLEVYISLICILGKTHKRYILYSLHVKGCEKDKRSLFEGVEHFERKLSNFLLWCDRYLESYNLFTISNKFLSSLLHFVNIVITFKLERNSPTCQF